MLADNVRNPFNEYLKLFVEYGIVGIAMLAIAIILIWKQLKQHATEEKRYYSLILISIGVFGCFSYPFHYPFILFLTLIAAAGLLHSEKTLFTVSVTSIYARVSVVTVVSSALVFVIQTACGEYVWNSTAQRCLAGETEQMLPKYARLYPAMKYNSLFLYNYGAELNYADKYAESNTILHQCAYYMNDIDMQLLFADNYLQLKKYRKAEQHLKLAHQMVPVRFIPLYRLALLYQETGENDLAYQVALQIVNKPVKIPSFEVTQIKNEMEKMIKTQ